MIFTQIGLATLGRAGIGTVFLMSMMLDLKARDELFDLMAKKRVKFPHICYIGALFWKFLTSLGLITNTYPYWCALLLSLYIFLANLVFNNFWSAPPKQQNFSFAMFLIHLATCFGLLAVAANI